MQLFRNLHSLFSFLLRSARQVRHARAIGVLVIVAGAVSGLTNTVMIGVVNHVINADGPPSATLVWVFLGVCALLPVTRYTADFLLGYLNEKATLYLRMATSRRILATPLAKLEEIGSARMFATFTNDIPAVIGAMALLPVMCMNLAVVAGSLVYMGLMSWQMLLGVLLFLVVGSAAYQFPAMRAQQHIHTIRQRVDVLFRHFRSLTEGAKELKLHRGRRRAFLEDHLQANAVEIQHHGVSAMRLYASAVSWGQLLVFILIGLIAFVLPSAMGVEKEVLTGYTLAILYMVSPVQVIMNAVPQLARATAAKRRVEELGLALADPAPDDVDLPPGDAGRAEWTSLELEGVTHSYYLEREQANFTLGPIDLTFRPGQLVFLTGGNGSGKTTLAKLLTGLYTPESGRILVDGVPVTAAGMERYHALFSVVFSDFYLFEDLLGLEGAELDAQAYRYLEELHLDHKVKVEQGKLSTTALSQGQRKRLALLTAYLEDRPIYLFDEWAADQDPQFKHVFYCELLPQLRERGKTVFVISHDDRYYPVADRLIKLDFGQVVEDTAGRELSVPLSIAPTAAGAATPRG